MAGDDVLGITPEQREELAARIGSQMPDFVMVMHKLSRAAEAMRECRDVCATTDRHAEVRARLLSTALNIVAWWDGTVKKVARDLKEGTTA